MSKQLSINNLSSGYGRKNILKNANLVFEAGEFCALLGLNASGKTTLLKTICGLLKPAQGSCLYGDEDFLARNEKERARIVSYIPQRHSPMYGVSVLDVVMMGFNASLGFFMSPSPRDKEKADQMLNRFGLLAYRNTDFSSLSEGQKQMVILARTLLQNTPIMLLDEPDSALDFNNRHSMLEKVQSLIREENKIGLIAIHDPNFALAYCDRLILLLNGHITFDLKVANTSIEELTSCLAAIYGDISITQWKNQYIMMRNL
ncbi:iron complex transport system ATP-binding protein [Aequitasia blattaphilus]|uniref:ABC transporter ATP-binding protein n=1 Tax=Aequitasia blattaphilus TaxID=2949332 RepID=A0ABT1EAB7_9FIRM|nr:ABC transporter ATP-binding protein [Aequitasia blattaphilus]MCP1101811.1 ABC transporter ATP-binding protein [Aequitasia blattaphilus]MCR8614451.1 ABC transporter ATP-binding protein [Aequitasia blattaphilus]